MADFLTSTHRAKWIFSPQDIKEKHKAANQRARQALEKLSAEVVRKYYRKSSGDGRFQVLVTVKYGSSRVDVNIDGSFAYAENQIDSKDNGESHSKPKALKVDEEQLLKAFYEFKIQDVCDAFKFPRKIQATALIYFKRFYLQWSVMEHNPKEVMLTCIYAACKAEENHVSAEELGKGIGQDHQVILNNEMLVLQSLGFDLIVFAPYRALEGFLNDYEEFSGAKGEQLQVLENLRGTAIAEVDKIMRTDAPLFFPPGQLALTALRRSVGLHGDVDVERYLKSILSRQQNPHALSELTMSLDAVDTLINKLETPSSKEVKHIDRKLKSCLDPVSHDKSKKRKHRSKDSSADMLDVS